MTENDYTEWQTFKGTTQRTGAQAHEEDSTGIGDGNLDAVWSIDGANESSTAPAVVGELLIAGKNPLGAYRVSDGERVWTADLGDNRSNSPAVGDGLVVVTTHSGEAVALDVETGVEQWRFDEEWASGTATIHDSRVLVPTRRALVALDAESGEKEWDATGLDGHIKHAPTVADGTVVVGGERGLVLGVDVETGQQEWLDDDRGRGVTHTPAALANLVFVPNGDDLICYDADTGDRRWEFSGDNIGTPAIADRTIFVVSERTLYALDGTGSVDWSVEFEYSVKNPTPAVIDDTVVIPYKDALYGYDLDTGEEVFEYPTDREIESIPVGAYGAALVATSTTGDLQALLPRGEELRAPEGAVIREDSGGEVEFHADEGWSTGKCDPQRTGALPDASGPAETPGERWQYGQSQLAGVALADGTAYVAGATSQELAAVDVETGIASWEFDAGDRLVGQPVVTGGTVYTGDDYGVVYAVDAETGEERWQFDPQGFSQVEGSPTVVDGTVYLPTGNGDVYAVDAETGETEWSFETRESFQNGAVVTDDHVITPCDDGGGTLYGLDRESGDQRWSADVPGFSGTYGIAAGHGLVFVGTGEPSLLAADPETGIEEWTADLEGDLVGSPTVGEEYVFAAVDDRGKALVAIDVDSGTEAWSNGFGRAADAAPALADGVVYVPSGEGLHAIEADSGRELFTVEGYGNSMAPVVGDGYALFQSEEALRAYDEESATAAAEAETADGETTATAGTTGSSGGPGSGPDEEFRVLAAEDVAEDPDDPGDDAIRATALGVLVDAWHEEFTRGADLDFETMLEFVSEQLPGVTEQTLEFNLEALDGEGAVDYEPAFKTTTLRARGLDHYYTYTEKRPVPNRDLLGTLQPLYDARREGGSVTREQLIEETGLDADYLDRIVWMLHDQGVFAGDLYISGPGTGAVDVYAEGASDGWWMEAQLTEHGRQLFEEMR